MNPNDYRGVWPEMIPALEAALQRYEQANVNMANFKKKLTSQKNKAKRIEKYVVDMEEAVQKAYQYQILDCVRMAENKFILIDKNLKRFHFDHERFCKGAIKLFKAPKVIEPNMSIWYIQHLSAHLARVNSLIYKVDDMLRIAKGHLAKVDETKKRIAQGRKRGWFK